MMILAGAYPNAEISEATAALWRSEFSHIPEEAIVKSARIAYRSGSRFFPSVPEFAAIVTRVMGGQLLTADEAWASAEMARAGKPGERSGLVTGEVLYVIEAMDYAPWDMSASPQRLASVRRTFVAMWNRMAQDALDSAASKELLSAPQLPVARVAGLLRNGTGDGDGSGHGGSGGGDAEQVRGGGGPRVGDGPAG